MHALQQLQYRPDRGATGVDCSLAEALQQRTKAAEAHSDDPTKKHVMVVTGAEQMGWRQSQAGATTVSREGRRG